MIPVFVGAVPIGAPNATGQTLASLYGGRLSDGALSVTKVPGHQHLPVELQFPKGSFPYERASKTIASSVRRLKNSTDPGVRSTPHPSIVESESSKRRRLELEVRALVDVGPVRFDRDLIACLQKANVSVIHSLLGNVQMSRAALGLSSRLGVPIVPHFMDDWPSTIFRNGELRGFARAVALDTLSAVVDRSPLIGTVGERMAGVFAERYGRETFVAANGYFGHEVGETEVKSRNSTGPKLLAYAGGLHLGRLEILVAIADLLRTVKSDWVISVSTPSDDMQTLRTRYGSPNLIFDDPVTNDAVGERLSQADALLFVESSRSEILDYTRLSVSTKVPQYVAARRPILVVGPHEQSSVRALVEIGDRVVLCEKPESGTFERLMHQLELLSTSGGRWPLPFAWSVESMRYQLESALDRASTAGLPRKE